MMDDTDCVGFLQWCLPRLQMRWAGFRKVRAQVCKRVARRMEVLDIPGLHAYRERLENDPEEWAQLDAMCRVTISRVYRDHGVFDRIVNGVLPELGRSVACWSAGCASGEEPYTLSICWHHLREHRDPTGSSATGGDLTILATDIDPHMLDRARTACYQRGTLKELPDHLFERAFEKRAADREPFCLQDRYRAGVTFREHDVRDDPPDGPFDLILCRNLAFMYFDDSLQRACLGRFSTVLRKGGGLVIGKHESLPDTDLFEPWFAEEGIFRHTAA